MSRFPKPDRLTSRFATCLSNSAARNRKRQALPSVESLEDRQMLSTASAKVSAATALENQTYIDGLVGTTHVLSAREVALKRTLTAELNAGMARSQVTLQLLKSLPSQAMQAQAVTLRLLRRAPTVKQLNAEIRILRNSGDERGLVVSIASSGEYYRTRGDNTPGGFVTALYHDILQHAPSTDELLAGQKALKSGVSRANLARWLINSHESSSLMIEGLHKQQGMSGTPSNQEFLTLRKPGGLLSLRAGVLASDAVYQQIVRPRPATPAAPSSTFNPHPPGFPIAPGFDLTSRMEKLAIDTGTINSSLNGIGAGADGTLWLAGGLGLATYDVNSGVMTQSVTGSVYGLAVAPLSKTEAYAIVTPEGNSARTVIHVASGTSTTLPSLPNSDTPAQISASTDGIVWVIGSSGALYSFDSGTQTWATIATQGYSLKEVSVGSATNIVALTSKGEALVYTTANGFQPDPDLTGTGTVSQIQATADGAVWASVVTSTGNFVYMKPSYGTMQPSPVQPPAGTTPLFFAAGSQYRAYQASTNLSTYQSEMDFLNIGITDSQALLYPDFTGAYEQAYLGLSQAAGIYDAGGVRSLYNSPGQSWGTISSDIATAQPPSNFDATVWGDVQTELKTELNWIGTIYGRFELIKDLITRINTVNNESLSAAEPIVGLSKPNGPDANSSIGVVLLGIFEAIASAISSTGIPPAGAVVAAMLSSGFDYAVSAYESGNPPGPNGAVQITYSNLETQLSTLFESSFSQIDTAITSLVTDYGKAKTVAEAILNGQWPYINGTGEQIAKSATGAFNLYFYQSLIAAKWQIVQTKWGDYNTYPFTTSVDIPGYDNYEIPLGYQDGLPVAEEYFMNQIGSQVNLNSKDLGPFPTIQLLENIGFPLAPLSTYQDVWTGTDGWQIIQHVQATE